MNILLTCVGRRNYLVDYFKEAVGENGTVLATNSLANTAGMFAADKSFVVPPISESGYVDSLLSICKEHKVRLLLSLFDLDTSALSKAKDKFEKIGTFLAVPSPEIVNVCHDKWETYLFCQRTSLATPKTFIVLNEAMNALIAETLSFPVVVKPRWGCGSIGVTYVSSKTELELAYASLGDEIKNSHLALADGDDGIDNIVIQEFVSGKEFGVDIFNDLNGNHLCSLVKEKIEMRAGETDRAITVANPEIENVSKVISRSLKHICNLDTDIIMHNDVPYVLEFNPRFGGHYPFAHLAGADLPKALVALVEHENLDPDWFTMKTGVVGVKGIQILGSRC